MALYSVWDWRLGLYRHYRSLEAEGLFDPDVARLPSSSKNLGFCIEDALVELPRGCQFVGTSDKALGRLANDATSRSQAQARLPAGIGGVEGAGGTGIIPFVPFLGLGSVIPNWDRVKPVVTIVLAFAAGALILKGLSKPKRSRVERARNAGAALTRGQSWRRGQEHWHACPTCARPLGPARTKDAAQCLKCRICGYHRS